MDAQITKERLYNFLSYDWLKMIASALVAVLFLLVLFTTTATRATDAQTMEIYCRSDLTGGTDSTDLDERIKEGVFSYEILNVIMETFSGEYASAAFSARRAAGEGDAVFYSDYVTYNEDGSVKEESALRSEMAQIGEAFLNVEEYFADCKTYLDSFYGGDYTANELDMDKVRESFFARNDKDKRFKTTESKEQGVVYEKERIERLNRDYTAVLGYFEEGILSFTECTVNVRDEGERTLPMAIRVGGSRMRGLTKLVYYTEKQEDGSSVRTSETVHLALLDNGVRDGDLRYERISFIRYLVDTYKDTQA